MERRRPRTPPAEPLVLVVDDHDDTRDLYATALARCHFETMSSDGGRHAFECAWKTHPDAIVTELPAPGPDRWRLVRDLKGDCRTRDIPVVVVTGYNWPGIREEADREGCAAVFVKPYLPDGLAIELRRLLDPSHAQAHATTPR
jgi:CheY-like chemotaxis protein